MPTSSDRNSDHSGPVTTRQRRYRDQHGLRSTDIAWHTASLLSSLRTQTGMRNDELLAWATRLLWDFLVDRSPNGVPTLGEAGAGMADGVASARVTDSVGPNDPILLSGSGASEIEESVLGDATAGFVRPPSKSRRPHKSGQSPRAYARQGIIRDEKQIYLWPNSTL